MTNTNTVMENFTFILIEQLKIFGITFLVSLPFALIFFPLAIVVWSIGGLYGWVALFIAGFKIMQGKPLDQPLDNNTNASTQTPEEWLEMKKTQDDYKKEKNAERKEALTSNANKAFTFLKPFLKVIARYAKLVFITLFCLFVGLFVVSTSWVIFTQA